MVPDVVTDLEAAAVTIVRLVEEGERRAAEEQRRWEEQPERWRREEAERRRLQNIKASREELAAIIDAWQTATGVERFFADAERRAESLDPDQRAALMDRLRRARELLGGVDALQHFSTWKAPEEQ
jgi:hypothetical protein